MGMGSSKGGSRATLSEINVTPLVDVMLVLLIMFMVTTPLMQQGIEVSLPKTSATGVDVKEEPFVLVVDASRKISAGKELIDITALRAKLEAIFKNRDQKQVFIQADKRVDYGLVAEVMAEIKAAGILSISLITLPKDK